MSNLAPEGIKSTSIYWYLNALSCRVVAESGNATDMYHLGKLILKNFREAPEHILQIEAVTGEKLTFKDALEKSIKCANAFINIGLQPDDVVILMAPNHLDLCIPYYAALYMGNIISSVDWTLGVRELIDAFKINQPKLIVCQNKKVEDVQAALNALKFECRIISFGSCEKVLTFNDFLKKHGAGPSAHDFRAADFNADGKIAFLIPTSGSTGKPKCAALSHEFFLRIVTTLWDTYKNFPTPTRMAFIMSPLQWATAHGVFISGPLFRITALLTHETITQQLAHKSINKYKPTYMIISPTLMTTFLKPVTGEQCDFTCFERIVIGGSAVSKELMEKVQAVTPNTRINCVYGATEVGMITEGLYPIGSVGKPTGDLEFRLIDINTQQDITEPNKPGELWLKTPSMFKGYYKNPEGTKQAYSEDGWFKTGDILYRDENLNFYFVERLKLLLKYRNHQIAPTEIEDVIRLNPDVLDVAVVGIPDTECGELPTACVVKREGSNITAEDIKKIVKENLTETKHLHGGVIFIQELPLTSTTKIHRQKLKTLAQTLQRE